MQQFAVTCSYSSSISNIIVRTLFLCVIFIQVSLRNKEVHKQSKVRVCELDDFFKIPYTHINVFISSIFFRQCKICLTPNGMFQTLFHVLSGNFWQIHFAFEISKMNLTSHFQFIYLLKHSYNV